MDEQRIYQRYKNAKNVEKKSIIYMMVAETGLSQREIVDIILKHERAEKPVNRFDSSDKVYISYPAYYSRGRYKEALQRLREKGVNTIKENLEEANAAYFLEGWERDKKCNQEMHRAKERQCRIYYEEYDL